MLLNKKALFRIVLLVTIMIMGLMIGSVYSQAQAEVWRQLDGQSSNVNPSLFGPVYNLGGGGKDVNSAIQWTIDRVRGCRNCSTTVDVVVLRFLTDRDQQDFDQTGIQPNIEEDYAGYNQFILAMNGVNSVETLVFSNPSSQDINTANAINTIKQAEVIFLAGGNQCKYIQNFQNLAVKSAIESVINKKGAIGGTSAGAMIQGEWIYNSCLNSITSSEALNDPYQDLLLTDDFLNWSPLQETIIDTHFSQRDRMGRDLVFIARQLKDKKSKQAWAIAVDERTSVIINQQGIAEIMGDNNAYFILGDHQPEVCEPRTPLTFSDYKIWKLAEGETFDLIDRPTTDYDELISVVEGEIK